HYTIYFEPSGTPSEGYAPEQGYGGVVFNDYSRAGVSTFAVRGGAQSMTLPLSPGVEVKGKVVLPDGVPGPAEVEVERLEYVGHGGVPVVRRYEWVDMIETAPNGEFATRVIPGAWYSVAVKGTELIEPMSLNPPYLGESFSSARLVSGPTTLPTMTLQRAVPVRGRVTYQGTPAEGATARLVEIDPAGNRLSGPATTVAADGTFEFSGGAFPGRRYTVSVNYEGTTTYPGLARSRDAAVTYEAGPSGLTIPEFPLIVTSGPDWTRSVSVPDGVALRGSPTLGTTLSVRSGNGHLGVTSSTPGAQVIYRWTRDGEFIPGATGPQYTLTEEDQHTFVGALVVVRAPGRIAVGQRTNEVFVETGGAPYATSHPVVSGSAKVGGKLSVSRGSWSVPSVGLAYQWLRDGQPVVGATKASYVLKAADRGKRLSV